MTPSRDAIIELARRPSGYLAPMSDMIADLHRVGLVNIPWIGDGYVIVVAVNKPISKPRRYPGARSDDGRWYRARVLAEVRI